MGSYRFKVGAGARWVKVVFSENVCLVLFNPQNLRIKNLNNIIIFILHSTAIIIFLPVLFEKMSKPTKPRCRYSTQ